MKKFIAILLTASSLSLQANDRIWALINEKPAGPTQSQINQDILQWRTFVGTNVPYVPPTSYPRPSSEFLSYKQLSYGTK